MKSVKAQDIRLFEFLIAIVVVLLLIFFITRMNLSQKGVIDEVNFEMAKQNFDHNASLIHAQWLLEGRPSSMDFKFYIDRNTVKNTRLFHLTRRGWPLVDKQDDSACYNLWFDINNVEASENISHYLSVKKIEKSNDISCQFCDAGDNNTCIEYSGLSGVNSVAQTATH